MDKIKAVYLPHDMAYPMRYVIAPEIIETTGGETSLPTIMCIESRIKQQDILRDYLSKRGFRVLVLSDLERGLNRLRNNPPNGVIFMGEFARGVAGGIDVGVTCARIGLGVRVCRFAADHPEFCGMGCHVAGLVDCSASSVRLARDLRM